MRKWLWFGGKYGVMLVLALALLLCPILPALAAEADTEAAETEDAATPISGLTQIWDDLSYTKYLLRNNAFYDLDDKVLKAETIEDLAAALKEQDPWAQYYPADTYGDVMERIVGDFVGIGVYLREDKGKVTIVGVIANSPAEKAGLRSGDFIVEVDGTDTRQVNVLELQALLRGEENTLVSLKFERNGKVDSLIMSRKRITQPSMEYWIMEGGIGYTRIDNFTSHTGQELADAVKSLKKQGLSALIVDLRDCPGGEIEGAVEASGVLSGEGPMIFFMDKWGWQSFAPALDVQPLDMPLALLINGNTASSAELVAANVQDAQTGALIGETTFGKGVVQSMVRLPSGAGISFTTDKYISSGYQDVDAQGGVMPDIYITGEDAQLEKAVEWLNEALKNPTFVKYYATLSGYSLGGVWQNNPATVLLENNAGYIPLLLTLTKLGWELEDREGLTYAQYKNQRLILDAANSKLITGHGEIELLSKDGQLYMPAALLRDYGHTVTWSDQERSITVKK